MKNAILKLCNNLEGLEDLQFSYVQYRCACVRSVTHSHSHLPYANWYNSSAFHLYKSTIRRIVQVGCRVQTIVDGMFAQMYLFCTYVYSIHYIGQYTLFITKYRGKNGYKKQPRTKGYSLGHGSAQRV